MTYDAMDNISLEKIKLGGCFLNHKYELTQINEQFYKCYDKSLNIQVILDV